MTEICSLSLTALAGALQKREISAAEAVQACLDRMEATEPRIAAMLHVDADGALARARQLDAAGPDPGARSPEQDHDSGGLAESRPGG